MLINTIYILDRYDLPHSHISPTHISNAIVPNTLIITIEQRGVYID